MLLSLFIITGFKYEITEKLSGFTAHLSVVPFVPGSTSEGSGPWIGESLVKSLKEVEGVKNVYGYIEKPAIFKSKEEIHGWCWKGRCGVWCCFSGRIWRGKMPDLNGTGVKWNINFCIHVGYAGNRCRWKKSRPISCRTAESECLPLPEFTTRVSRSMMMMVGWWTTSGEIEWLRPGRFQDCYRTGGWSG